MKVVEEGYLNRTVILLETIGYLEKGRIGVCTADLKSYDVFAVWFREPVRYGDQGDPIYWVSFSPWSEREKFDIIE